MTPTPPAQLPPAPAPPAPAPPAPAPPAMDPDAFRRLAHAAVDLIADHLGSIRERPVFAPMTPAERAKPAILNGSRRKRIAKGSGTTVQDVNQLIRQFDDMQRMMKTMTKMTKRKGAKALSKNLISRGGTGFWQ